MTRSTKSILIGTFIFLALVGAVACSLTVSRGEFSGLPEEAKAGLIVEGYWRLKAFIFDDSDSQFQLGMIELYRDLNKERAVRWFNLAACAGHVRAKEYLRVQDQKPSCE